MLKKCSLLLAFTLFVSSVSAQNGDYLSPLTIPLELSGNFGEVRSNHFHSGIDFKTAGVTGQDIVAVADGYVSRIYVSPSGYGKALYIYHPATGTTSVYGHLDRFVPEIAEYVKQIQYSKQSFFQDIYPPKSKFVVLAGERVAFSGNSGSSGGPHLHFEIRNSASEPMNLLQKRIYKVFDGIAPTIAAVYLVEVDTVSGVAVHRTVKTLKVAGQKVLKDTLRITKPSYFALEFIDKKRGTTNIFGSYSLKITRDSADYFGYSIDKFSFAETRYVNTLCLYPENGDTRNEVVRSYVSENNKLSIYDKVVGRGIIVPNSVNGVERVDFELCDDSDNRSKLSIFITRGEQSESRAAPEMSGEAVRWKSGARLVKGGALLTIPGEALYDDMIIGFEQKSSEVKDLYSAVFAIGDSSYPIQKPITLAIKGDSIPSNLRSKALLVKIKGGKLSSAGGEWSSGRVSGKIYSFGEYSIAVDTLPPTIQPLYNSAERQSGWLSFKISDNLAGVKLYRANINGEWALLDYDAKTGRVRHNLSDGIAKKGENEIEVIISDGVGNIKSYTGKLIY